MLNKPSKRKKSGIKLFRLVFLVALIASNSFAWFIYATKIDSSVSVHVKAWDVVFEAGENEVTSIVNVNVDSIYPGMEDYRYDVKAYNRSEVSATLSYQILEARILNDTYITKEGRGYKNQEVLESDYTSAELEQKLKDDYPFSIFIDTTGTYIEEDTGIQEIGLNVLWPYESNQDELDTEWGINANTYKKSNPSNSSIALVVKIIITQNAN